MLGDPTQIMMDVMAAMGKARKMAMGKAGAGWGWSRGVSLYFNPELVCPFCNKNIPSNRYWLVDERRRILVGVWRLNGTRVRNDGRKFHPHAHRAGGMICSGTAKTVPQFLFNRPNSAYSKVFVEWLMDMGHICDKMGKMVECPVCKKKVLEEMLDHVSRQVQVCSSECSSELRYKLCHRCFKLKKDESYLYAIHGAYCSECHRILYPSMAMPVSDSTIHSKPDHPDPYAGRPFWVEDLDIKERKRG